MTRIFLGLALLAVGLLVGNIVLGFSIDNYNEAFRAQYEAVMQRKQLEQQRAAQSEIDDVTREIETTGKKLEPLVRRKVTHFLLGLVASLVTLLVNSITVTYFIGTSRWCLEVVDTYELDQELAARSNRLKRQAFPWALGGAITVFVIVALGAFSDPAGPFLLGASDWVTPHMMAAILGTVAIAWSLWMQAGKISANYAVIEEIVADVQRIRKQRGLE